MYNFYRSFKGFFYNIVAKSIINYVYDARRFIKACNSKSKIEQMTRPAADSHLFRAMHSLEKGMALPSPTPDFGTLKAETLREHAEEYGSRYGKNRVYFLCMSVLDCFSRYRVANDTPMDGFDPDSFSREANGVKAGVKELSREEVWESSRIDFARFAFSRSSVRVFEDKPVDQADILGAIDIALKSPSVCNRSCARAYLVTDKSVMEAMFRHQGGAKGFGAKAGALVVVAADMEAFYQTGERNQGWIDGGLFAMSLNYALHAMGYGVCMLNWSKDARQDARFRKEFSIPDSHLVVMLMAVGHLPEKFKVAFSPRPSAYDVAWKLDSGTPERLSEEG